jgi:hemerythrin superfamily protein
VDGCVSRRATALDGREDARQPEPTGASSVVALPSSASSHTLGARAARGVQTAARMVHAKQPATPLSALDLLTEQHATVDKLIKRLESAGISKEQKRAAFIELADSLAAHATIEEKIFYPAVLMKKTEDMLLEATEEHLQIKRILADMLELDVEDAHFDAKLSVLKEELTHHAHEEEEDKLFPKLRKLMSSAELQALGGELLVMFDKLMTQEPRKNVPKETGKPAAL